MILLRNIFFRERFAKVSGLIIMPKVLAIFRHLGLRSNKPVSTAPGQMVVTPTLYLENSKWMAREKVLKNRLVEAYSERYG